MKKLILLLMLPIVLLGQEKETMELPFKSISEYPETFSSGNIIARLIDGLGYRYYWATDGLNEKDLMFSPSDSSRTSFETLEHIHDLSLSILRVNQGKNLTREEKQNKSFDDLRRETLENLKQARDIASKLKEEEIKELSIIFGTASTRGFPYWNLINGQISDAIYHTGQIVSFRRSSGNPISSNVNVFIGKNRD